MKSYNIGYKAYSMVSMDTEESEVQFDIETDSFEDMFIELWALFRDYCEECGLRNAEIIYVTEAPHEGE